MFEKRKKYLSARQFLVPGLADLSEEELDAPPAPSLAPVVLAGLFGVALAVLAFVR